jgi:hypothetical protein
MQNIQRTISTEHKKAGPIFVNPSVAFKYPLAVIPRIIAKKR